MRVPKANLLGERGLGLRPADDEPVPGAALDRGRRPRPPASWRCDLSLAYAKERTAFGKPIGAFQHNRFLLAEMATEAHIARVFVDDCLARHLRGELDAAHRLDGEVVDDRAAGEAGRPRASSCTAATAT